MKKYRVGVVGALGAVGTEMLKTLEQRDFPIEKIKPLDIPENEGKMIVFRGERVSVEVAREGAFKDLDIALFSAGEAASLKLSPVAAAEGCIVIDNSNAFRMNPAVPLVIPEVNPEDLKWHKKIIANPNCSTIQMLVALKPLHDHFTIRRIVVSTYQAVSGTGIPGMAELESQVRAYTEGKPLDVKVYPHQIAFNAIPHIDVFMENGYSREEMKMVNETHKMLHDDSIAVCPTAVRIPVVRCHSEAINIETEKPISVEEAREILEKAPGVKVMDDLSKNLYPLAADLAGTDYVYVGRIRKDISVENGLNMWVVADNLRKGAALNAVQIAETLIKMNLI
ncbi:aspartate-semialdehyde dehydrogenase [Biomaibacter acetigenes]|jgi:aspartate-semialdehyde dehydrogenase|uniref:Aspartate-semialdehyde dehydrogenase n=1 Tax=Biomaibacter acetigenes TaxID=2316383 RepID=A0A3G2R755_9FIRM|nr:aspartate-semialdehyde dehydrogenase [Biomaibacter acetigenes]AYO31251.1 aspartate-semialdehyde dehydrogenase [Biomaibacter acetigenes]MDN5301046.1 aspartate-semialdehyde dehydrogenase [Thermoanaerobacteraceae bacterium]RKL63979.1 aspartate-semialdehyde dehydrogenase [Thermoanaerobacteraceae bacterium SP2]